MHFNLSTIVNPSFFNRILVSLLVFSSLVGVFLYFNQALMNNSANQCVIGESNFCSIKNDKQDLSIRFLQNIELEEEISLEITINKELTFDKAWVQGVNMYMGKTPIIIESQETQGMYKIHTGVLFLGACSEPKMRWQLIVQTKDSRNQVNSHFFNFKTSL